MITLTQIRKLKLAGARGAKGKRARIGARTIPAMVWDPNTTPDSMVLELDFIETICRQALIIAWRLSR